MTATGSGYSAAYDAAGNMICRAPSSTTTCSGTQTGQQLSYDTEGQLSTWQNQPSPTSTVNYLYDGEGTRVASQLVNGGTTTLTSSIGQVETIVAGSTSTTTTYYSVGALRIAEAVNGTFSYLGGDALGSTTVALNASGQLTAAQLYGPYGNVRYSSGTMPTDIGFTGQRGDSATGLDYYNARYYDPVVGQFMSADAVLPGGGFDPWGLSRYAYVAGNPETNIDPTGHRQVGDGSDDWSNITSDGNGGWTQFISQSDPVTHKVWVHTDHYNQQGTLVKAGNSHPLDHHHVDQCGLPPCDSNANAAALAGAVVLSPEGEFVCVAAPEVCVLIAVGAGVAVITALVHPHSSSATSTSTAQQDILYTIKRTEDGPVRVRRLTDREVRTLKTPWGTSFHDEKQAQDADATDDIYVDSSTDPPTYYIGRRGSDYVEIFP